MWLNENAGVLMLIIGILILGALGVSLWILFTLRSQFCVQKLRFTGLYATDRVTRTKYASLTIGNKSVREIAIKEIGIKNGGVAFDLTALYRYKAGLDERAHIVIEQRYSIDFSLSVDELKSLLPDGKGGRLGCTRSILWAISIRAGSRPCGNCSPTPCGCRTRRARKSEPSPRPSKRRNKTIFVAAGRPAASCDADVEGRRRACAAAPSSVRFWQND